MEYIMSNKELQSSINTLKDLILELGVYNDSGFSYDVRMDKLHSNLNKLVDLQIERASRLKDKE